MNKQCKDCGPDSKRPIFRAGRCATHDREFRKDQKERNHDRMVQRVYGLEPGEYPKLYAFQGGRCAICRKANGRTKALSVDHNHATGAPRALLCGPCNQMIGRLDAGALERAIAILTDPATPYERMRRDDA